MVYNIAYDMLYDMPREKSDMPQAKSLGYTRTSY